MAWQNATVLAVVPARGGSKGIHKKNLQPVAGVSLIGHVGQLMEQMSWLDRGIVSTDDEAIADEARTFGIDIPFLRPCELATDTASSIEVWRHAWLECEQIDQCRYDVSVLLEPTSPMRRVSDVEKTLDALFLGNRLAAATVSATPAHFSPHKTLQIDSEGLVQFYLSDGARYARRQEIPAYYHRNGICYAARRKMIVDKQQLMEDHCAAVIIDREVVNIDEPIDLEFAEFLMRSNSKLNPT